MSLIYVIILLVAIVFFISGKRVYSICTFFFLLFDSFQLVPVKLLSTKSSDFAIIYVLFLFIYGCIRFDNFIPRNKLVLCISIFLGYIVLELFLSHFYYHIPWLESIRTGRQSIILLAYFIFRRIEISELRLIFKILFIVVLFQCCLFIPQIFIGKQLLAGSGAINSMGAIYRCYNLPYMIYFFVFYALFSNPFKNVILQNITKTITVITILGPMHRSLCILFILIFIFGLLYRFNVFSSVRRIVVSSIICFILFTVGSIYMSSRTINDMNKVLQGEFIDIEDSELDSESTLLFRFAHLYERYMTASENTISHLFGMGFMAEGSPYTYKKFDFIIGLEDNKKSGGVVQLDTSDISWSNFVIRYGIVGTIIYMIIYMYITIFYLKRGNNPIALPIALNLMLVIGISLTSDQLYLISTLIFALLYYEICYKEIQSYHSDISV